jgi:hypothetical protein|tara:strand:+ start:166 stop:393 length:228 start_codon:yes stop_codon:yes gene_type:complete
MIEVGTKIIGNFGAMIPLWEGVVWGKYSYNFDRASEVVVEWDDGSTTTILQSEIDSAPSVNGSPIGYYTEEGYYA